MRRGVTLEKALKKQIPIFEKEAFATLDPESSGYKAQYDALIQKYYGLQIKALQMMGIIENEAQLNPLGTNINRPIPYFDTRNISQVYLEYIKAAKTKRHAEAKETAPYIEYIDVQLFPGDTYGDLFAQIKRALQNHHEHFQKYPNLQYVGQLNDSLKREFLKQCVESSIKTKQDSADIWGDILAGKIKPGTKFILHLSKADEIIKNLRLVSYGTSVDPVLKKVDNTIVDAVVPTTQNRNLIKTAMVIESYERKNNTWYKPDGLRLTVKQLFETYPILQRVRSISSFGDFQIRIK